MRNVLKRKMLQGTTTTKKEEMREEEKKTRVWTELTS
jgi:hypothetical protein